MLTIGVYKEQVADHQKYGCDGSLRCNRHMVKHDVERNWENGYGCKSYITANDEQQAADEFGKFDQRHQVARGHDAVHKSFDIASEFRHREKLQEVRYRGEQEHESHKYADNNYWNFHNYDVLVIQM